MCVRRSVCEVSGHGRLTEAKLNGWRTGERGGSGYPLPTVYCTDSLEKCRFQSLILVLVLACAWYILVFKGCMDGDVSFVDG